ncbi:complex I subunit 4 family protein [Sediminibacterium ginsengisoli]|uniref:NADH dehydrogenase subunit M n=1 Tax=Sediminibacterium ginsengisoli TaxID=413434 RepID=A0A1T4N984_9BACT|nr:NADH-quinone oxidoreductase subunit M [Sediminibacterium ginsengisoli]SJZ75789.1 NADH dehydrogenase subunit M [Sediminibacterium ginsengisoli]
MIPVLLISVPLVGGLANFFLKEGSLAKTWALLASVITLAVAVAGVCCYPAQQSFDASWIQPLGARFSLSLDGMSKMLTLLTAVSFPLIFGATFKNNYQKPASFYGLMLLAQAGLMGVFLATDALLFYFFWELALIPVYFLCSIWGGERRIQVTFKFFVYTFVGSLLMLIGILVIYFQTPDHSFALQSFYSVKLQGASQQFVFWLFFLAFAIKMPVFPFHTWQPDAYEQSPTATTMVLSGIMVKMGIFAVIRWLLPVFPDAAAHYSKLIIILSVTGMLYASLIAIRQDDIKRMIAYSSIAHIGLMCAAIFAMNKPGLEGVMIQMFNHGINVIGLWIVADAIEKQLGTRRFSELGGLAQKAPALAILFVVMAFANIALPLTNAFVGEFLMFNGLFRYNIWIAAVAGISIILAAVYTLNSVQKIFYGNTVTATANAQEANKNVQWVLVIITLLIIALGVYPQPLIDLTKDTVNAVMAGR